MLHAVIMAGGSGTRFWPMSRQSRPKHLLKLLGPESLLQCTVTRIAPCVPEDRILVITGSDHAEEVRSQLPKLARGAVIAEPCRRDTAPCIGLAAVLLLQADSDAKMLVLPADHVIAPDEKFHAAIERAAALVRQDEKRLVTLGIRPDRPATGYGYIQRGAQLGGSQESPAFAVTTFREKPTREVAAEYVRSGEFYWNSGVFLWSARTILEEIRRGRPAISDALERIGRAWRTADAERVFCEEYERIDGISIDYAVLEASSNVVVVEAAFQWDDVGSWGAVERLQKTPPGQNTVRGRHCEIDTKSCIVLTDPDHLVATIGVEDLIIVQCGKATLVANKGREESVKQLVEILRKQGNGDYL
jgi:mannose-1-phosphate guanylyltransferase